ncbi:MAG: hypothetical protein JXA91_04280 [Candidatus Thermoplasmatota archaeon]|nr:hypothetical protein [Candidatus Thermoplasmatota archaeon]
MLAGINNRKILLIFIHIFTVHIVNTYSYNNNYKIKWNIDDCWKIIVLKKKPTPRKAVKKNLNKNDCDTSLSHYLFIVEAIKIAQKDTVTTIKVFSTDSFYNPINVQIFRRLYFNNSKGFFEKVEKVNNKNISKCFIYNKYECLCQNFFSFPLLLPVFDEQSNIKGDTLQPESGQFSQVFYKHNNRSSSSKQNKSFCFDLFMLNNYVDTNSISAFIWQTRKIRQYWEIDKPWWIEMSVIDGKQWYLTGYLIEFNGKRVK